MVLKPVVLAAALALLAGPAFAGMSAPDAQMHFKAIASGNVAGIMKQYTPDATFEWIGGPLDGTYTGTAKIRSVWQKFAKANGKMTEKVSNIAIGMNPDGMTVTADVKFIGKKTIPVRYVLAYRNGKIIDEIWQIAAPKKAM